MEPEPESEGHESDPRVLEDGELDVSPDPLVSEGASEVQGFA